MITMSRCQDTLQNDSVYQSYANFAPSGPVSMSHKVTLITKNVDFFWMVFKRLNVRYCSVDPTINFHK